MNIFVPQIDNYSHIHAFDEVALYLQDMYGGEVSNLIKARDENIVLGWHLLAGAGFEMFPPGCKVFQLEQIADGGMKWDEMHVRLLKSADEVWDYSVNNSSFYDKHEINWKHVPLGYSKVLDRIPVKPRKDIDVLFYGSMNDRRRAIIDDLRNEGLNVQSVFDVYEKERDDLIASSKIVLNLHFYETSTLEIVRLFYLVTNGVFCVSEKAKDMDNYPSELVVYADYDDIVEVCKDWVGRGEEERKDFARKARESFVEFTEKHFKE